MGKMDMPVIPSPCSIEFRQDCGDDPDMKAVDMGGRDVDIQTGPHQERSAGLQDHISRVLLALDPSQPGLGRGQVNEGGWTAHQSCVLQHSEVFCSLPCRPGNHRIALFT